MHELTIDTILHVQIGRMSFGLRFRLSGLGEEEPDGPAAELSGSYVGGMLHSGPLTRLLSKP